MQKLVDYIPRIQKILNKNRYLSLIIVSAILVVINFAFFKLPKLGGVTRIVWLLLLINSIISLVSGYIVRRYGMKWWAILIFPLVFLAISLIFKPIKPIYTYFFAPLYVVVSLFTYWVDYSNDTDENQIPMEGGFGRKNSD